MSSIDEKVERKSMSEREFMEELDRRIRNGTADVDSGLGKEGSLRGYLTDVYEQRGGVRFGSEPRYRV